MTSRDYSSKLVRMPMEIPDSNPTMKCVNTSTNCSRDISRARGQKRVESCVASMCCFLSLAASDRLSTPITTQTVKASLVVHFSIIVSKTCTNRKSKVVLRHCGPTKGDEDSRRSWSQRHDDCDHGPRRYLHWTRRLLPCRRSIQGL